MGDLIWRWAYASADAVISCYYEDASKQPEVNNTPFFYVPWPTYHPNIEGEAKKVKDRAVFIGAFVPHKNLNELFSTMIEIYEKSSREDCLKIFNAHPELVVEKKLTKDSRKEQNNASLNQCSNEEFNDFQNLNIEYKKKFGFPFIIAVKGKNKEEILNNFKERIKNENDLEFKEAKKQVKKIADFRLKEIIS